MPKKSTKYQEMEPYYTPAKISKRMIEAVQLQVGETIYDPACGVGTLLLEAYRYITNHHDLSKDSRKNLLQHTFYGREIDKQTFAHARESFRREELDDDNLWLGNTLLKQTYDRSIPMQYDVVLSNPPLGIPISNEEKSGFKVQSGYSELLFLQHAIDSLKPNGRCAMIVPERLIARTDKAFRRVKERLLKECELQEVIRLDDKTYEGVSSEFNIIVFKKGKPTEQVVYRASRRKWILNSSDIEGNNFSLAPKDAAPIPDDNLLDEFDLPTSDAYYRIFISYRHADTPWAAARIHDAFERKLKSKVFLDYSSIPLGRKFNKIIEKALSNCEILLVVIGPKWQEAILHKQEAEDWVRKEIESAIERQIDIFPILIDGAKMPSIDQLPDTLGELTRYQAIELGFNNFNNGMKRLIEQIKERLDPAISPKIE
ncbi:MAG TPA: N-6 DNA methylase [Aggregatilineales bacterium]|nr:N-6 DNA methylase [Aggregatilineales bacterium]